MQLSKAFGLAVVAERKLRKITQAQLAEIAGLHPTVLSAVETALRPPKFDTLERISDALEVPLSRLFKLAEETRERHPEL
ncbi:hypothetical protein NK8_04410 [Caballeronia sp. NK8]|uniref:helix-turn-helix domain-containing protein n=1 Tax=Caballeronia sp. NK8 TaxID=140098 RepID=UPI001BB76900|nr:helix-turn-helix transcriptional regulator [Caballeronia sp. NK8]BCQ22332.1 hypothetical protein NK8_04410 [Caballeronia sp. NK8]